MTPPASAAPNPRYHRPFALALKKHRTAAVKKNKFGTSVTAQRAKCRKSVVERRNPAARKAARRSKNKSPTRYKTATEAAPMRPEKRRDVNSLTPPSLKKTAVAHRLSGGFTYQSMPRYLRFIQSPVWTISLATWAYMASSQLAR